MAGYAFAKERSSRTCAHVRGRSERERAPRRDLRPLSCSTGLCIKLESKARMCAHTLQGKGSDAGSKQKQQEMRRVVKCGEPSPQPRAPPLGDGSAAQSCRSEAPRCLGGLVQSSSSSLKEGEKKQTNKHEMHFCMHTCMLKEFRVRGVKVTYRRSGRLPCGSWRFPGGSRRRTDTSNPRGRGNLPPADATR